MTKKLLLIGGGSLLLLLAILFGAFFAGPLFASAQSNQSNNASTASATNPYCEQYLQDLANRLHVSVSTLQQDKLAAREDVLAQLVKDGKLTQKQADAIKQRLQSRQACTGKGNGFELRVVLQSLRQYLPNIANNVAQKLNISTATLQSDLKSGMSLTQIASKQGVSQSQLHTIVLNAVQSAVNQAVSDGNLTQSQGSAFMTALQQHPGLVDRLLDRHFGKKA